MLTLKEKLDRAKQEEAELFENSRQPYANAYPKPKKKRAATKKKATVKKEVVKKTTKKKKDANATS